MPNTDPLGDWIAVAPWRARALSLLLVAGDGSRQADTLDGKRDLVRADGRLFALWHGQWRTDAREITADDREVVRALLD